MAGELPELLPGHHLPEVNGAVGPVAGGENAAVTREGQRRSRLRPVESLRYLARGYVIENEVGHLSAERHVPAVRREGCAVDALVFHEGPNAESPHFFAAGDVPEADLPGKIPTRPPLIVLRCFAAKG